MRIALSGLGLAALWMEIGPKPLPISQSLASLLAPLPLCVMQGSGHLCSIVIPITIPGMSRRLPVDRVTVNLQGIVPSLLLHNSSSPRYEIGLNLGTPFRYLRSDQRWSGACQRRSNMREEKANISDQYSARFTITQPAWRHNRDGGTWHRLIRQWLPQGNERLRQPVLSYHRCFCIHTRLS
ncbi:hypothetical protein FOWG_03075 [Fusarium oxysporum f. sp. lycopersici MN25]|uniref:Uncharacterized protein n=1 Tax=Fusarium oxysporum Fo47 TaxID=660027 RepID=W9KHB3_FUSOX|nr:hypothetical protein FOZG_04808 [Fusarium oxysporum Fo47]EWZ43756.1 hypothetical protein FOZG_04808 [Fusarium oxysporum Fo47]EWZ99374.1 hypothetical protein FOWG_03075 [Fusarium oxysporum f. sp. lycopersici MN25]EWZ99375.1 hypothetical protein FOWG_03075 [Fusarium oxysporum f. sp. lycopersici MN25]